MIGTASRLIEYMDGAKKRFIIPVYQRNYDWRIENCRQLYDDLVKLVKTERKSHFFGSFVSVGNQDGHYAEYLVIDGQQRLTTVSLLLLAMYNLIIKGVLKPETNTLSQEIYEGYLVDKFQPEETRIKLKSVKDDQHAFSKLFREESEYIAKSNLTINYRYFYDRIQKQEITLDELFDAICNLQIINISLNNDDNPQLIFESLNSTGVALSEGDKIRNFMLMGLKPSKQNSYYEKYWNKIEECTDYDVSAFIRDYLSVKQQAIPSKSKVYFTFKYYVSDNSFETEALLVDMLAYAKWYEILLKGNTQNKALDACIYRLNHLETTVTRPFFLEVLRLYSEDKLSIDEVADIFLTTENYLFRRTICNIPTNALNKIFLTLNREIIRYDDTSNNYVQKYKYAILSKKERARFPDDTEFARDFSERQVYLMNSKNKIYIMERLENFGTIEDKDVYRHFDDGSYSIEHIMPQNLTPGWAKALGDDYQQIHEKWLHRLANLTLTAYNSKYSNSSFNDKKNMENGFLDSGIRMNAYIARQDKWTLVELKERDEHLIQRALDVWPTPETSFRPPKTEMSSYTLDDDVDLTGRLITKFSYKNMEQPVKNWVDMYERVLKLLHSDDKSVLYKLAYATADNNDLAQYISNTTKDLRSNIKIDEDIYAEINTSTWSKLVLLKKFFDLYDVDPTDLVFYLRDDNDSNDSQDIPESQSGLLYRYWSFALDYIKKAHEESGLFGNVHPIQGNWLDGFFGINRFSIRCVVNQTAPRTEVVFARTSKEENKNAFDDLYKHKKEIEDQLGKELQWDRCDNIKLSRVYIELKNVSLKNETDWLQMANFHADWSKKFYDVIVPYIRG
ncbi:MAG: DUF4268 domain-containing protein [Fastidiosipila sp.]|nr:DUF4268 domain-containing protein [Fastidiosipila sp.]